MSRSSTPARRSAAITARASAAFAARAARAFLPSVTTPKVKSARFGSPSAVPVPDTVIERVLSPAALTAGSGCPIPAKAATASAAAATTAMRRSDIVSS
jgi:hypothetical protein